MIVQKTLDNVEEAIRSVFGITYIERRSSLNLQSINKTPYATVIVGGVSYDTETIGFDELECTVTGAILFKNEKQLIEGMDAVRDFADVVGDGLEVRSLSFERITNESDSKTFNFGMIFTVTTGG